MKRLLRFLGAMLLTVMLTIPLASCEQVGSITRPKNDAGTKVLKEIINPDFTSVNDVLVYHSNIVEEYLIDETFRDMPQELLCNIATVCLKKVTPVTKKDIVYEYLAHQEVYDNLPRLTGQPSEQSTQLQPDVLAESTQQPEVEFTPPNTPAPSVTTHTEDDTIDGVPLKVTIKEEKTYERK
jgi:hypothetical protein